MVLGQLIGGCVKSFTLGHLNADENPQFVWRYDNGLLISVYEGALKFSSGGTRNGVWAKHYYNFPLEQPRSQDDFVKVAKSFGQGEIIHSVVKQQPIDFSGSNEVAIESKSLSYYEEECCCICLEDDVKCDVVCLPCNHQALCIGCSTVYQATGTTQCPICRKEVVEFKALKDYI